jgi:L,D-transpeptidase YcbB
LKKSGLRLLLGIALISIFSTSCKRGKTEIELQNERVTKIIAAQSDSIRATKFFPDKDVRQYLHREFNEFYKKRNYQLAWVNFEGPLKASEELLDAIDHADEEGLEPENYNLSEIEKLLKTTFKVESRRQKRKHRRAKKSLDSEIRAKAWKEDTLKLYDLIKLDFVVTASYLTYASHLLSGKINPNETELWFAKPRKRVLSEHLEQALRSENIKKSLEELLPKHPQYALLKSSLRIFTALSKKDTFPKITINKKLKLNESHPQIAVLANKLRVLGDLPKKDSSAAFTPQVSDALKHLQARHGLEESGNLNTSTLAVLNEPIKDRIEQIKVNMERMRWLPDNFGDRYVLVNIPEFKLRLYEQSKVAMEMKVIVGTNFTPTPVFSDSMEFVVLNPTWTVPTKIILKEFLPKLIDNPKFLEENNYKLYDSWKDNAEPIDGSSVNWSEVDTTHFNMRIVEGPGDRNSLGKVKFMFPNNLDIYLHDTPGHGLFNSNNRTFSHGCIRLEKPLELAEYLLKGKGWDRTKIEEHIGPEKQPETVMLPKKIPVHIVYWTAWVNDNNTLNFRKDIYSHDQFQEKAIKRKEALL